MNKQLEFLSEPRFSWLRHPYRRSLLSLALALVLGATLYFTLRQPLVQRIGGGVQLFGQTLHTGVERMLTAYFGPEVLLRRRAHQLVRTLAGENERLHWLEAESTTVATTLDANLQALRPQLIAARAALPPLAVAVQHNQLKGASGQPLRPDQVEILVAEKLRTFTALESQVALYEQARQLHLAAATRAHQLQTAAQRQAANLETYLLLFEATAPLTTSADADEQWSAIRTEFQTQLDQAAALPALRQDLEQQLANGRTDLTSVDRLLMDSTELTAQLHQLTALSLNSPDH